MNRSIAASKKFKGSLEGYTVIAKDGSKDAKIKDVAYIVADTLSVKAGKGSGVDLLIDVEQVQFGDSSIDLGLRIEKMDWDNNKVYDHVMVSEPKETISLKIGVMERISKGDDSLTASTSSDVMANNEIMGKDGNDIIYGYGGGDRISGDGGNDFIDGGANGVEDAYGYIPKDDAIYYGKSKNYIIKTYKASDATQLKELKDLATQLGITVDIDAYGSSQEFISVQHKLTGSGSSGTDILTNIENLQFQDMFMPLAKEQFVEKDAAGNEVFRFVNGTSGADIIEGGNGNDELIGNAGNDTITGGIGGDTITPGSGSDIIDGGKDGADRWTKMPISDRVIFEGKKDDYTITDSEVDGVLTIKVADNSNSDVDTITNVEILQFEDRVFVGVWSNQRMIWNGKEMVAKGYDYFGSMFGDTIIGTDSSDYFEGEKERIL